MNIDGAVFYTDGSARPNPGFFGSGVHGYAFRYIDESAAKPEKPTRTNGLILTDEGYRTPSEVEQGLAKGVVAVKYLDAFRCYATSGTNNQGEINAVTLALTAFPEVTENIVYCKILSDSEYVVKNFNESLGVWKQRNWKTSTGSEVKNIDDWLALDRAATAISQNAKLVLEWVRGHNDDFGNVISDYLAGIGTNASASRTGVAYTNPIFTKVSDVLGYHKKEVDMNPLISHKRIYFNTEAALNEPGVYYTAGWSGNDFIMGKRTNDASYSVVRLKEPDPVIETVRSAQAQLTSEANAIMYLKTDRLRDVDVYEFTKEHGQFALYREPRSRGFGLNFVDRKPVSFDIMPGELTLRAIDALTHLEVTLATFEEHYLTTGAMPDTDARYEAFDITEFFYTPVQKKVGKTIIASSELKKEFVVGIKSFEIPHSIKVFDELRDVKFPLIFSDDIPARNVFKRIEQMNPKVFLVSWRESAHVLRYATVVMCDESTSIWCNYYANLMVFK